ncbi:MAG: DUF2314 domain-containing protein [Planctomycetota bacterium]
MNPWILSTLVVVAVVVYVLYRARGFDRPLAAFQPPEATGKASLLGQDAPWRADPALRPLFIEGLPDDVPADFQDPGQARQAERMWVRLDRRVADGAYEGTLLNVPKALRSVRKGDRVSVRVVPGGPAPIGAPAGP